MRDWKLSKKRSKCKGPGTYLGISNIGARDPLANFVIILATIDRFGDYLCPFTDIGRRKITSKLRDHLRVPNLKSTVKDVVQVRRD
jgi:hypothetical protein